MKLRNRKTGDILYALLGSYPVSGEATIEFMDENSESGYSVYARYKTLAELNEEWEDYKPAEPLIKDKKIRKAVRAWWESIQLEESDKRVLYKKNQDLAVGVYTIYCGAIYPEGTLKVGKYYTIAELCGEEEE